MKDYVFYNKKLGELFNDLCTAELGDLRKQCIDIDKQLSPYRLKLAYNKNKYIVTRDGEPLDEYGYGAKSLDEIKLFTLSEAIDFIDYLKDEKLG